MDVIGLYQGGVKNVAASLGTALTDNQAKLIKRYTNKVVLSYDSDNAGRNAALRGIEVLTKEGIKTSVLHVTDGKDPDEFIKLKGKDAYLQLVDKALPAIDYRLVSAIGNLKLDNDTDKIEYIKKATQILQSLSPVEQDVYITKLAKKLKISESAFKMEMNGKAPENISIEKKEEKETEDVVSSIEKNLLKIIFTNEDYLSRILQYRDIFASSFAKKVLDISIDLNAKDDFGLKQVNDCLDPDESLALNKILDEVKIGGKEEQVFTESVKRWKLASLKNEEKEILTLLSIADETENFENMKQLTVKLENIQNEKKKIERESI